MILKCQLRLSQRLLDLANSYSSSARKRLYHARVHHRECFSMCTACLTQLGVESEEGVDIRLWIVCRGLTALIGWLQS